MFSYATKSSSAQLDPNFKQVSTLLHGDGTNGTQNNTFLDSSTNNYTITRTGAPTQGTFTPFSQAAGYWSNYFPTSSYAVVATNAAFTYGTGDFTMECWVYLTTTGTIQYIIDQRNSGTANAVIPAIYVSASDVLTYFVSNAAQITGTTALVVGTWYHVAVSKSSGNTKMFLNGIQEGSTYSDSNSYVASRVCLNVNGATGVNILVGYTSNVRLVKGTAVYTDNFTPSTIPLTAITNTSLLTCQSNRFIDNSSNNFALTLTGTPQVQPWSPFAPTSAYNTSVIGGSGYFSGSAGNYLSATYNTSSFDWWTTDYTIEGWVYPTTLAGWGYITASDTQSTLIGNANATSVINYWSFGPYTDGTVKFKYYNGLSVTVTSTNTVKSNQWNHIAMVKNSSGITLYVNGIKDTNSAVSGTPQSSTGTPLIIGQINTTTINGYISSIRIVKGTALYTASFTPPTAPLTAITNTTLLLNGTNSGIVDNAIKSDIVTVGSAQINTSVVKYGTGSISFNGTTSYLNFPNNTYYAFGTSNFTIEAWVYPNSVTALQSLIDTRSTATATTGILISITALGFISVTVNNAILFTSSTGITISAWTHVAVVKNGSTITLYLNGTKPLTGSGTSSTSLTDQFLRLGASAGTAANFYNGYLDEVRITNGIARYTANFTPPTAPFPNQ